MLGTGDSPDFAGYIVIPLTKGYTDDFAGYAGSKRGLFRIKRVTQLATRVNALRFKGMKVYLLGYLPRFCQLIGELSVALVGTTKSLDLLDLSSRLTRVRDFGTKITRISMYSLLNSPPNLPQCHQH